MRSFSDSYRAAGVNIEAGYEGVKLMKKHVARTMIPGVVSDLEFIIRASLGKSVISGGEDSVLVVYDARADLSVGIL